MLNSVEELVAAAEEHVKAQCGLLLSEAMIFKRQAAEARLLQALAAMRPKSKSVYRREHFQHDKNGEIIP